MKELLCITCAFAAALLVQAYHWRKIWALPTRAERNRFMRGPQVAISVVIVIASTLFGIVAIAIQDPFYSSALAAGLGGSPLPVINGILRAKGAASTTLGPVKPKVEAASVIEFLSL